MGWRAAWIWNTMDSFPPAMNPPPGGSRARIDSDEPFMAYSSDRSGTSSVWVKLDTFSNIAAISPARWSAAASPKADRARVVQYLRSCPASPPLLTITGSGTVAGPVPPAIQPV